MTLLCMSQNSFSSYFYQNHIILYDQNDSLNDAIITLRNDNKPVSGEEKRLANNTRSFFNQVQSYLDHTCLSKPSDQFLHHAKLNPIE